LADAMWQHSGQKDLLIYTQETGVVNILTGDGAAGIPLY